MDASKDEWMPGLLEEWMAGWMGFWMSYWLDRLD
jgi:hypothetical protein